MATERSPHSNDRRDGSAINPYASPAIPDPVDPLRDAGVGVWRDGKYLVIHPAAPLPLVCVKSGQPAVTVVRVRIAWIPPGFVIRPPEFELGIPLCERRAWWFHRGRYFLLAIALTAFLAIPSFFVFVPVESRYAAGFVIVAAAIAIGSLGYAGECKNLLLFQQVKGNYFWLRGAHPEFLRHLPDWPYGK